MYFSISCILHYELYMDYKRQKMEKKRRCPYQKKIEINLEWNITIRRYK